MIRCLALSMVLTGPAFAEPLAEWAAAVPQVPMGGAELPDPVRQRLAGFLQENTRLGFATIAWAYVTHRPARTGAGPSLIVYAGLGSSGPPGQANTVQRGMLGLVRLDRHGISEVAKLRIPPPTRMKWKVLRPTDIDGDAQADALLLWSDKARNFTRRGVIVARTRPASMSMVELDSTTTTPQGERRVDALVACFFPVQGLGGKGLIVQRRNRLTMGGRAQEFDAMELFLPGPDGRFTAGQVYGAMFGADGDRTSTVAAWGKTFSVSKAARAVDRQAVPGDCPAAGLVLPQRAVGQPAGRDAMTVVGPFATTSDGVWSTLNALGKRAPRAAVVIGIGSI